MRILIDIDDTVVNFHSKFVQVASEVLGRTFDYEQSVTHRDVDVALGLTEEENSAVYDVINLPGFARTLEPLPDAIEIIKSVSSMEDIEIIFVTAVIKTSPTWTYDRSQWLESVFGPELGERVEYGKQKYAIRGDILIEDSPKNALAWQEETNRLNPGGIAMLVSWPFNEGEPFPRLKAWTDFPDMLEKYRQNLSLSDMWD